MSRRILVAPVPDVSIAVMEEVSQEMGKGNAWLSTPIVYKVTLSLHKYKG